ncbi:MAG: MFS transporter [Myxococcales bacterium]|nr:MFS transporter [Myxococcales bacterium]
MAWLPPLRGLPRAFWYLCLGTLVNRAGGFVVPFLALYLTEERELTAPQAGFVVSLYGVGSFASAPVGGFLADRIGRRFTIVAGTTLGAGAMLALGFSRAPSLIAASALGLGFLGDLPRPAVQAAIADLVAPADRARAYGFLYWAINLGFSIAPVIAGLAASRSFSALFIADAATTLVMAGIVLSRVPESLPSPAPPSESSAPTSFLDPYHDGVLVVFLVLNLMVALVFHQSFVALPIAMRADGISTQGYGLLIAINGVLIILLQPFALAAAERFRRSHFLAAGALLTGIGFGLTAVADGRLAYALSIAVWTLGEIAFSTVASAVVADLAPPSLRGSYQGAFHMSWGASAFLAPALGTAVLAAFGSGALWGGCAVIGLACAIGHLAVAGPRRRRVAALRSTAR